MIIVGTLVYDSDGRSVLPARGLFVVSGLLIVVEGSPRPWNAYSPTVPTLAAGMVVGAAAWIPVALALRPGTLLARPCFCSDWPARSCSARIDCAGAPKIGGIGDPGCLVSR